VLRRNFRIRQDDKRPDRRREERTDPRPAMQSGRLAGRIGRVTAARTSAYRLRDGSERDGRGRGGPRTAGEQHNHRHLRKEPPGLMARRTGRTRRRRMLRQAICGSSALFRETLWAKAVKAVIS